MKRVTKKQSWSARKFAEKLLSMFREELGSKYRFAFRLVGSAKWNIILKDNDGNWDLDYQLLLTKNSNEYKENKLNHATSIKNDFFNCLNDRYKDNPNYIVQNSTTAVTFINKLEHYSFDFVIIRLFPKNTEIIRRNNKKESSINEYTWNQLPKHNEAYDKFKQLSPREKKDLIENYILPRKAIEKTKKYDDPKKIPSCEIFIQEVNNYVSRK